jgi:hypothetical protein
MAFAWHSLHGSRHAPLRRLQAATAPSAVRGRAAEPVPLLAISWRRRAFHRNTLQLSQAVANLCGFLGWNARPYTSALWPCVSGSGVSRLKSQISQLRERATRWSAERRLAAGRHGTQGDKPRACQRRAKPTSLEQRATRPPQTRQPNPCIFGPDGPASAGGSAPVRAGHHVVSVLARVQRAEDGGVARVLARLLQLRAGSARGQHATGHGPVSGLLRHSVHLQGNAALGIATLLRGGCCGPRVTRSRRAGPRRCAPSAQPHLDRLDHTAHVAGGDVPHHQLRLHRG